MPKNISPDDWERTLAELTTESDRSASILAATAVEFALEHCITYRLHPMSNSHYETVFGDRGPLGTFSSKIEMGLSLGLYGQATHTNLHFIRRIRNQFAHFLSRDFQHAEIDKWCKPMTHPVAVSHLHMPALNRFKFLFVAGGIIQGLAAEAQLGGPPPKPTHLA